MTPLGSEFDHLGFDRRRVERWLWGVVVLGIGIRGLIYTLRFPIWTDEAKLAVNLLDRGYAELLEPYAYGQIATFLFMWLQKTATLVLGVSEYSLRVLPWLSGIGGLLLMRHLARRLLAGAPLLFAVALYAFSYYPVRHAAEAKPYATDLLASIVLTAIAIEWLQRPSRARWLWGLACLAPIAILLSYTAVFVAAGILIVLMLPVWRERSWSIASAYLAAGLLAAGTFWLNYALVIGKQLLQRSQMNVPWPGGFPSGGPLGVLTWLLQAHTGRTFGYPLGSENGGSILTLIAFVAGAAAMFAARRRLQLALLLAPLGLALVAASLGLYPYGGSGRVSQYMVPAICLLAGLGGARIASLPRREATRRRLQRVGLGFLLVFGVALFVGSPFRPYRDRDDMYARDFARWFWEVEAREAELVCAWMDLRLEFARPDEYIWATGAATYRINQRIYSRRIRRGVPPDLTRLSERHPLRVVVLGSVARDRAEAVADWLSRMRAKYRFLGREKHGLGYEGRQNADWVEVFVFVPRSGPPE